MAATPPPPPPPTLPLLGRVAIVTGASRGIGRAIALHFASLGASLVLNYSSNPAKADLLAAQINSLDPGRVRATAFRADISLPSDVKALFDHAHQTFGHTHILVNCAGVIDSDYPPLLSTSDSEWDRTFAVNARGAFLCFREAGNRLVRGGGGRIVAISSSMVGNLSPGFAAYAASKAAAETMIRILAKELKGTQITANCVAPGPIATDMFFAGGTGEAEVREEVESNPMGRLGEPKDVASVVGFLACDAGEWVNGQIIRVNGGVV